jgi:DNA-binding transcriptional ArsR family regulator
MKYTLAINQKQAIELGIKNLSSAIIFDYLTTCATWADTVVINNEVYYWVARTKIIEEIPLLDLKPDSVYRHLKILSKLGLIEYKKQDKKDIIKITKLGSKYLSSTMSEKNPKTLCRKKIRQIILHSIRLPKIILLLYPP